MKEGVACYQDYLRGLLDLTDNLRRRQGRAAAAGACATTRDDPYLVVAADKGTATFSDYANAISAGVRLLARRRVRLRRLGRLRPQGDGHHRARRLGSRSSATSARWASTRRRTDFTVVGIGDMSGDVFGNGMLLSRHIRLVAAFDHRHVFLDPEPRRRRRASPSASACSSCRARRGPTTTRS